MTMLLATLAVTACGGNTPAPATAAESPPAEPSAATETVASPSKPSGSEDEGWAGEKPSKSDDSSPASATTEPAAADGKAPETRTMDVIRQLVMEHRKAARQCYDDARKDDKDLKGDVVIHFVLNPEGKVKSAELNRDRSTLKSPKVVDCVIGVIKSIPFPKSSRAMETTTNYPFNFTP